MAKRAGSGRGKWRTQAWITGILVVSILVFGNRVAREHLALRKDLSEDQLYTPSSVGVRMMGELDDLLQVKAFFTGDVKLGAVQIAKRRLIDQLEEYVAASKGRLELTYADPNTSSEARAEATALGMRGEPIPGRRGTSIVTQDIWLGLVLRYRAREIVLPFVMPQTFEYSFLGGLRKLMRDEDVTVGFLVEDGSGASGDPSAGGVDAFTEARTLLAGQYRLREVTGLEGGEPVPADVSVLVVARPTELHPRAAFALDQFVQRGGRMLVLVDRVIADLRNQRVVPIRTGLEDLLRAWGAPVSDALVWDPDSCNSPGGRYPYPLWPVIDKDGLDTATPVTAQVPKADLFWAHPIPRTDPVGGLERTELMRTTETAWQVEPEGAVVIQPRDIQRTTATLAAELEGRRYTVGVSLAGRFPSPFAASGAPAPFDPMAETLFEDRVRRAREAGEPLPVRAEETTDEPVLDRATESQVVVIGDAEWATRAQDREYLTAYNALLFVNLIDWLAIEDDLIALRSRVPTERRIDDFLQEERRALGLVGKSVQGTDDEVLRMAALESRAEDAAAARRWRAMAWTTGASYGAALLIGLLWRFLVARASYSSVGGTDGAGGAR